jgi:predicted amidohydrolase
MIIPEVSLKIGLVQYHPVWENKESSKSKIVNLLKRMSTDLDLLIFPELTLTGFTMRSKRFSEKEGGESTVFFASLAAQYATHIFFGYIEEDEGVYFNTLTHLAPDKRQICKYRKIHPFSYTGENRHYASGKLPKITTIEGLSIGLSICYDLRFPELFRYYAKKKVDMIIDIANWPVDRIDHWYSLLKARAIENQCYMIGVNRVGSDKSIDYPGWTSVFHPFGQELLCCKNEESVNSIDIEKSEVTKTRHKYPFLNDIRLI